MRTMRRSCNVLVVMLLVASLAACAATTALGTAKEALLIDRDATVAVMAEAIRAHEQKLLTDAQYVKVQELYGVWQKAHNAAVDAVIVAQKVQASGGTWNATAVNAARMAALNAATAILTVLQQYKIVK